ncbi:MAG: S9 family peptidase [Saprospiraceae bacterium]|nr:S9 family peptidase [Saprospiraceae bacterium]
MSKTSIFFISLALSCTLMSCGSEEPAKPAAQYTIEQFFKNENIGNGSFSTDGSRLLFHSNKSGIYNLYEVDLASGEQRQVTRSEKESFYAVGYVPGTADMLYSADQGGNEISHLYLLSADGTTRDLTPGKEEVANFAGWNKDKTHLFYASNKRNPQFFDLYKMKIGEWKPMLVYQNDEGADVAAIDKDGQQLALTKTITTTENKMFLYHVATKEIKEISDPAKPGSYAPTGFSLDGKSLDYTTDVDKEFAYLVRYDLATGDRKTLFEAKWDVMYAYNSENEKYRVIAVNEDGKNSLTVLDNASGKKVDFPAIPDGDILAVEISPDESKMRLSVGSSSSPNNLYLYNFADGSLKKLTNSLNPEIAPEDLVSGEVVRFKSFDGLEIPAIYYKPKGASASKKVPALVWVHGGPGGQSRLGYFALTQYLVNHGYAILAVNNRGSSGYGKSFFKMDDRNHGDKDLKDCIWGKKWLQEQNYIDGEKIGIIGGSYGGYMTMAALTFAPDEFEVGVNIFGVTNWLRTLKSIPPYWASFRDALYTEMGDPYSADSVRLHQISPLFHAKQVKKPLMVLQGSNDPRVLQVESDEIVAAVKKNGVTVDYMIFPDEGHGFVKKENEILGYGKILTFLDTHLKNAKKEMKN